MTCIRMNILVSKEFSSIRFKVSPENAHKLVLFLDKHPWTETASTEELLLNLKTYFNSAMLFHYMSIQLRLKMKSQLNSILFLKL